MISPNKKIFFVILLILGSYSHVAKAIDPLFAQQIKKCKERTTKETIKNNCLFTRYEVEKHDRFVSENRGYLNLSEQEQREINEEKRAKTAALCEAYGFRKTPPVTYEGIGACSTRFIPTPLFDTKTIQERLENAKASCITRGFPPQTVKYENCMVFQLEMVARILESQNFSKIMKNDPFFKELKQKCIDFGNKEDTPELDMCIFMYPSTVMMIDPSEFILPPERIKTMFFELPPNLFFELFSN
jgi:hypothetical protein